MRWVPGLLLGGLAMSTACAPDSGFLDPGSTADTGGEVSPALSAIPEAVIADLDAGYAARVIVEVSDTVWAPPSSLEGEEGAIAYARAWQPRAAELEARLPDGVFVQRRYRHVPMMVVDVDSREAAEALLLDPDIVEIMPDMIHEAVLAQSLPHIGQPAAAADGHLGQGTAVVVGDTGVDWTHADFGSCTSPGSEGCRVVYAADIAPEDNQRDDPSSNHGTNVAGIVAGVAPGTDIIGLDIFQGSGASGSDIIAAIDWSIANQATYNIAAVNLSVGGGGYNSPCSGAYETAFAQAKAAGISVVVASGNNGWSNKTTSPGCAPSAFTVGAVHSDVNGFCGANPSGQDTVACFSNSASFVDVLAPGVNITAGGFTMSGTSMATPHTAGVMAVMRGAFPNESVDQLESRVTSTGVAVSDYRNGRTLPRVDLDAATQGGDSGDNGGGDNGGGDNGGGDNGGGDNGGDPAPVCNPTVSPGSIAPSADGESGTLTVTVDDGCSWTASSQAGWITLSSASGSGNGTVFWTADRNSGSARSGSLTVAGETVTATQGEGDPPTGAVIINGGDVATNQSTVLLTLNSPGADIVCISSDPNDSCRRWYYYEESMYARLKGRDLEQTVYVWFATFDGTVGPRQSDSILYDRKSPKGGDVLVAPADQGVTLAWLGFEEQETSIVEYRVAQAEGNRAPRSCDDAEVWRGTAGSVDLPNVQVGTMYSWRVCAVDLAGNVSKGATATFLVKPEYDGPDGAISVVGGPYVDSSRVVVQATATDETGVARVCVDKKEGRCRKWEDYTGTPTSLEYNAGNGAVTLYAYFEDTLGNVSGPFTTDIVVDSRDPRDGDVTATIDSGDIVLSFSGFTDGETGIGGYRVMMLQGDVWPAKGCEGTPTWTGSTGPARITGLTEGATYRFRVCGVDLAGNTSKGEQVEQRALPEGDAPVGTITLNGGDAWTGETDVEVTLSVTDASGVSKVCLATTDRSCRKWVDYAPTLTTKLRGRGGEVTVYAWFEDAWGTQSATPVSDSIQLDTSGPTDGTVTALPGTGSVTLAWSGFSDHDGSGIVAYRVVAAEGRRAPRCTDTDTIVYEGSAVNAVVSGLASNVEHAFRVCAMDLVGNGSKGAQVRVVPN